MLNPNDAATAQELFDRAIELPADDRAAFLDEHCPDQATRATVERLLHADAASDAQNFLTIPPIDENRTIEHVFSKAAAALSLDPLIGRNIGRYQIKSLIGVGGMARVYEAVQEEPRRIVALKVMDNRTVSRSALRRFQYESQLLGRLRHPNIAQIYEAGTTQDPATGALLPYFAMEYVAGARSITAYANEHALDARARLELFITICDAVQYAHQRGIIHRDLKPGNLLIGAGGDPKVIDFGVARGTDSDLARATLQTHVGDLVGTFQYMSPEQCDGDPHEIDTRSDVYALGIILFELIVGAPPYDVAGSTIVQAARRIRESTAAALPTDGELSLRISRRLRADLNAILRQSLQKDREKRYASVAALADDLRRSLAGNPITARAESPWAKVTRWIYRRPATVTVILCAFASALTFGGMMFVTWRWSRQIVDAQVDDAGRALRLNCRDGTTERVWGSNSLPERTFRWATILAPTVPTDPARPLLIAVAVPGMESFKPGLNVRDADNPEWPGFTLRVEKEYIPSILRERTDYRFEPADFGARAVRVGNVFTEVPGDELVVAFQHISVAQSMLAVYDCTWALRYACWMDCAVEEMRWMPAWNQLLIVGINARYMNNERNLPFYGRMHHTYVVFALKLKDEFVTSMYVHQEPDERTADPVELRPVWYQMLPPMTFGQLRLESSIIRGSQIRARLTAHLIGDSPDADIGVNWYLDQYGMGGESPDMSENYRSYANGTRQGFEKKGVPKLEELRLRELPGTVNGIFRPAGSSSPK